VSDEDVAGLAPGSSRWGRDDYRKQWQRSQGAALLDRLLLLNIETYLLDDLLPKVDRTSMAHGLEVRAPFLDHELVEMALRLPPKTKMRGLSLKRCLKEAVRDLLPPGVLDRPKRGFGVPLDRWFREDLSGYLTGTLGAPDAAVRRHLQPAALDEVLGEHARGTANHGHALWTLLTLEVFLRRQGW
jgi:asparagine synthase (glutamine-hydrolysing)